MHSGIKVWAVLLAICGIYVSAADIGERQATCRASCAVSAGTLVSYYWRTLDSPTTVTAATIIYSVDPSTNSTSRLTRRNSTFDGRAPMTNSLGTRVATKTFTINGVATTTILAFPTGYVVPPSQYRWYGTLFTSGKCSTVEAALSNAVVGSYASRPPLTQPPATLTTPGDSKGLRYVLDTVRRRDDVSLVTADGAAVSCSPTIVGGVGMVDSIDTVYVTGQIVISNGQTSYLPPTEGAPVTATAPDSAGSTSRSTSTPAASSGANASFRRLTKTSMLDFDNLAGLLVMLSMMKTFLFSPL